MVDLNRNLRVEIKAQYINQELPLQTIQNFMGQTVDLRNVLDITEKDIIMDPTQSYSDHDQNFLFIVADSEIRIVIDSSKEFIITSFCLIQKEYVFSFEVVPASTACQSNIHVCHGRIMIG